MAILNVIELEGVVLKAEKTVHPNGVEEYVASIAVIRGYRHIGDNRETVKIDQPVIMSRNAKMKEKMSQWHYNMAVRIKGVMATRLINKKHRCPDS
jgi:hypothetical protein